MGKALNLETYLAEFDSAEKRVEFYSQGDPQALDYECGILVPVQTEGRL